MMEESEFVAALGGQVGGSVERDGDGWAWRCVCGETGTSPSQILACLAIYQHRRHFWQEQP